MEINELRKYFVVLVKQYPHPAYATGMLKRLERIELVSSLLSGLWGGVKVMPDVEQALDELWQEALQAEPAMTAQVAHDRVKAIVLEMLEAQMMELRKIAQECIEKQSHAQNAVTQLEELKTVTTPCAVLNCIYEGCTEDWSGTDAVRTLYAKAYGEDYFNTGLQNMLYTPERALADLKAIVEEHPI